jgi:hypothetical protein
MYQGFERLEERDVRSGTRAVEEGGALRPVDDAINGGGAFNYRCSESSSGSGIAFACSVWTASSSRRSRRASDQGIRTERHRGYPVPQRDRDALFLR